MPYWTRENTKARAQQNSKNRSNKKFTGRAGRRSYASSAAMEAGQYGGISLVDSWGNRHKKGEVWQSDIAHKAFDEMKASVDEVTQRMIQQAENEGNTLPQSFQLPIEAQIPIMAEPLGHKGKDVRGVGYVPSFGDESSAFHSSASISSTCDMVTRKEFDDMKAAMAQFVNFMMTHMTPTPGFDANSMMQQMHATIGVNFPLQPQPQDPPQPSHPSQSPTGSIDGLSSDDL